jgi:hypothetical protein
MLLSTINFGRFWSARCIRDRYAPMIPRMINKIPKRKEITPTVEAQPGTVLPLAYWKRI